MSRWSTALRSLRGNRATLVYPTLAVVIVLAVLAATMAGGVPVQSMQALAALATFVAAGVALYFGLAGQRAARRRDTDKANLVAARLAGTLSDAAESARRFMPRFWFRDLTINQDDDDAVRRQQTSIYEAALRQVKAALFDVDNQTLEALIPLPNYCAHRIAFACGKLQNLMRQMTAIEEQWSGFSTQQREAILKNCGASFDAAAELLLVAQRECESAAHISAPHPTGEEIYGPWTE